LIGSNQGDYFENATACSKRTENDCSNSALKHVGPFQFLLICYEGS